MLNTGSASENKGIYYPNLKSSKSASHKKAKSTHRSWLFHLVRNGVLTPVAHSAILGLRVYKPKEPTKIFEAKRSLDLRV